MAGRDRTDEVTAAFDRAVRREREAIARHEAAARRHNEIAARFERRADQERDDGRRRLLVEQASDVRGRADAARDRAARARQRLQDEGQPPTV